MGINKRKDGSIVKKLPSYMKFFPFIMPNRVGSSVYFNQQIVLDKTLAYCEEHNISIFNVFIAALLKLGQEKPIFNRFVVGKRIYQRDHISICFIAKKELSESSTETSVKIFFDQGDTLSDVVSKVKKGVSKVKQGDDDATDKDIDLLTNLPKWITTLIFKCISIMNHFGLLSKKFMDDNPLFSTAYVTNVGSIGIDAPYHHLYEFGTVSVFASLGKIDNKPIVENGLVKVKKAVNVNFTIDERIADGVYMAKALGTFVKYMEDPSLLN
jgi:hypothetical protein